MAYDKSAIRDEFNLKAKEAAADVITSAKQGEHVLDLGTGKGGNVFLAAPKIGPEGQVAGLDTSPEDLAVARREAASRDLRYPRVSFVQSSFSGSLPIQSGSASYVVSSSAIEHLFIAPNERTVILNEIYRVLAPGGQIAIHDNITKSSPPDANYITESEYEQLLTNEGFQSISFITTGTDSASIALYQIRASKPGSPAGATPNMVSYWLEAAGPIPKSAPPYLTPNEVATLIKNGASIAVVDVRKEKRTGGLVRGSHKLPAQTFSLDLPQILDHFKDTEQVVFYCNKSSGRGPRCAAWYQDYLDSTVREHKSKAFILQGGAQEWVARFKDQDDLVQYE